MIGSSATTETEGAAFGIYMICILEPAIILQVFARLILAVAMSHLMRLLFYLTHFCTLKTSL